MKIFNKTTIFIIFFSIFIIISYVLYENQKNNAIHESEHRIELFEKKKIALFQYLEHVQKQVLYKLEQDGFLNKKDYFDPKLLSSTYIARGIQENYERNEKEKGLTPLIYRIAATNPTNPLNQATKYEIGILNRFRNEEISRYTEFTYKNDEKYYTSYTPVPRTTQSCLKCHSTPKRAPEGLVKYYGTTAGFGEKIGTIRGMIIVEVPFSEIEKEAFERFTLTLIIIFIVFLSFYIIINILFSKDKELKKTNVKLKNLNDSLEKRVYLRTKRLNLLNKKLHRTIDDLSETKKDLISSAKMANLGELVSSISHEINSPLGISITSSSHLSSISEKLSQLYKKDEMTQEEFENFLNEVKELSDISLLNLNNTKNLVKSFKDIAVDQTLEERREFNVKDYIEEILLALKSKTKKTKIKIDITCDYDVMINSYPGYFSQILTNLINNSILHGFEKNIEGKINIRINDLQKEIELIYEDNGKGIPKGNEKKIFEQYFTTKKSEGGTGLGLYIIQKIVTEKLFGTIVLNKVEKGLSFIIKIPKHH